MSSDKWEKFNLAEITEIIGGGTPRTTVKEYWNGSIPWISVVDFVGDKKYIFRTEKNITQLGLENSSTRILKKGQIVISARGTVGELAVLGKDMAFNQSCYGLSSKAITSNDFLYYLLKFNIEQIRRKTNGAVFDTITRETFDHIEINLPPLPTQRLIVEILSALDDKIELNRQTNATLEAIAQTIFKEWFVNFNFPGATGELVDSELGMIPKGWRVAKLGEILDVKGGTTPSTKIEEYWNGEYSFATPKDLSSLQSPFLLKTERRITAKGVKQISSGILPSGILLLSSRAPIGYLAISDIPVSINQGFIAINAKETSNIFILLWLKNNIETVIGRANGSTFLEISKSNFREIKIILPEKKIFLLFDKLISPFFDQINSNEKQTIAIGSIRDTLLPKLMNGDLGFERGKYG
jgi:type I restriction enzyme S subunit